jgi:hypothetical protein
MYCLSYKLRWQRSAQIGVLKSFIGTLVIRNTDFGEPRRLPIFYEDRPDFTSSALDPAREYARKSLRDERRRFSVR